MRKFTRNTLIVGTCLKAASLGAQEPASNTISDVPLIDMQAGGFLKGTLKIGPIEAFGSLGAHVRPMKSEFFVRSPNPYSEELEWSSLSTPTSVISTSVGGNIRLADKTKITGGFEWLA